MDLPEIGYGTVHGRFLAGILDSNDPAVAPDAEPLTGYVEFWPTAPHVLVPGAAPDPATLLPQTVCVRLDWQGYLAMEDGSRNVNLFCTDDPDGNPVDWTWRAVFHLKTRWGKAAPRAAFNFALPCGETVDLTVVAPVPPGDGGTWQLPIYANLIDAKGDLIVGIADDTPTRLGVGPDGTHLVADSSVAQGVAWAPDAAGVGDATEAVKGISRYATQAEVDAGTDLDSVVRPGTLAPFVQDQIDVAVDALPVEQATETVVGVARIATQAEADAGTDDSTIVTPLKLVTVVDDAINALPPGTITPDATEAVKGIARYATQAEVDAGTDADSVVRPSTLAPFVTDQIATQSPPPAQASETVDGITRYATQAEVDAGTDADSVVRPATLKPFVDNAIATQSPPPPAATELVAGIAQLADAAEAAAGTDDTTIMTPLKSKSAIDLAIAASPGGTPVPDATEAVEGIARYATQAEVDAGTDAASTVRPSTLAPYVAGVVDDAVTALPPAPVQATETVVGIARLATSAEALAGLDDTSIVTPLKMDTAIDTAIAGLPPGTVIPPASELLEGIARYATQAEVTAGTDLASTVRPGTLAPFVSAAIDAEIGALPPAPVQATEALAGIAEIATQLEVDAGTDHTKIVTPLTLTTAVDAAIGAIPPTPSIPPTIFDAKGDLIVGTGPDAGAILPVGPDGTVPTADSLAALGYSWNPGIKVYPDLMRAEFETETAIGTVHIPDMALAFPNLAAAGSGYERFFAGPADLMIYTVVTDSSLASPVDMVTRHQWFTIGYGVGAYATVQGDTATFHRTFAWKLGQNEAGHLWYPVRGIPPAVVGTAPYGEAGGIWGSRAASPWDGPLSFVFRDDLGNAEIADPVTDLHIVNKRSLNAAITAAPLPPHTHPELGGSHAFLFDATPAGDPGSGRVSVENVGGNNRLIRVSKTDRDGLPVSYLPLAVNDSVALSDALAGVPTIFARGYAATTAADLGVYWEFTVVRESGTGALPGDGAALLLTVTMANGGGSAVPVNADEVTAGVARYATQAEVDAGVDAASTVRPSTLAAHLADRLPVYPDIATAKAVRVTERGILHVDNIAAAFPELAAVNPAVWGGTGPGDFIFETTMHSSGASHMPPPAMAGIQLVTAAVDPTYRTAVAARRTFWYTPGDPEPAEGFTEISYVPAVFVDAVPFGIMAGNPASPQWSIAYARSTTGAGSIVKRSSGGRAEIGNPVAAKDIANKEYVDGKAGLPRIEPWYDFDKLTEPGAYKVRIPNLQSMLGQDLSDWPDLNHTGPADVVIHVSWNDDANPTYPSQRNVLQQFWLPSQGPGRATYHISRMNWWQEGSSNPTLGVTPWKVVETGYVEVTTSIARMELQRDPGITVVHLANLAAAFPNLAAIGSGVEGAFAGVGPASLVVTTTVTDASVGPDGTGTAGDRWVHQEFSVADLTVTPARAVRVARSYLWNAANTGSGVLWYPVESGLSQQDLDDAIAAIPPEVKVYPDLAALEVIRTAEIGTLHVDNLAAAFPTLATSHPGAFAGTGPADLMITSVMADHSDVDPSDFALVLQSFTVPSSTDPTYVDVTRRVFFLKSTGAMTQVEPWRVKTDTKVYASMGALDNVRTGEVGILKVANLAAAFPTLGALNSTFSGTGPAELVVTSQLTDYPSDAPPYDFSSVLVQSFTVDDQRVYGQIITVHRRLMFDRPGGTQPTNVGPWTIQQRIPVASGANMVPITDLATGQWTTKGAKTLANPNSLMMRDALGHSSVQTDPTMAEADTTLVANAGYANSRPMKTVGIMGINQTTPFTVLNSHRGYLFVHEGAALTVVLPATAEQAINVGYRFEFYTANGPITFTPGVGATIGAGAARVVSKQFSLITVVRSNGEFWHVLGDFDPIP